MYGTSTETNDREREYIAIKCSQPSVMHYCLPIKAMRPTFRWNKTIRYEPPLLISSRLVGLKITLMGVTFTIKIE